MSSGRPTLPPRRQIILRIDEKLLAELYTLRPALQSPAGGTRYGALNAYFTTLVVQDLEKVKAKIRKEPGNG